MSSILDRVLLSQEITERQKLSPVDICAQLLKLLSAREAEVIRLRYGLDGEESKTLETIGARYSITRERVRQIEHQSIGRIRAAKAFSAIAEGISNLVHHALLSHGHIRRQDLFLDDLLSLSGDSPMNRSSLEFIIEQLLTHLVEEVDDTDHHPSWRLKEASLDLLHEVVALAKSILEEKREPLTFDDFFSQVTAHPTFAPRLHEFKKFSPYGTHPDHEDRDIMERVIRSYLECSRAIQQNPFGEWGLATWQSVSPRRMSDKIYLVLKKQGSPLHFTAITANINTTKFDHKVAHPPTVHNELILDPRFVLVGRGTYALQEWGYEPGVVADVIAKVLTRAGKPLTRDDIIEEVGKQRMVKKGTILLALTNRDRFMRHNDGRYALTAAVEVSSPPAPDSPSQ